MPTCIAPGNYLMRVEIVALHDAGKDRGAQFYMECAQINIKGSGTNTGSANSVSFPGGYQADHPYVYSFHLMLFWLVKLTVSQRNQGFYLWWERSSR